MTSLEAISGAVVSMSQISGSLNSTSSLIVLVEDVREELRRAPLMVQQQAQCLGSLLSILQSLGTLPLQSPHAITTRLDLLEHKLRSLQDSLHRYLEIPATSHVCRVTLTSALQAIDQEISSLPQYILAGSSEHVRRMFHKTYGENLRMQVPMSLFPNVPEVHGLSKRNLTDSKPEDPRSRSASAPEVATEDFFMHYTISEDRTGSQESTQSAMLAALGAREEKRSRFHSTDVHPISLSQDSDPWKAIRRS